MEMFGIKVSILLTCCLASFANGVIYSCSFVPKTWANVGSLYGCTLSTITNGSVTDLEEVKGTLAVGKTLEDVEGLTLLRKAVDRWPESLESFLPNLKAIQIYSSQITSISAENLKPFPNLEYLNLATNLLKTLPADLFSFTPNLKAIYFQSNKLESVGQGILDDLDGFVEADFQANPCISLSGNSPTAIENLKQELLAKCLSDGEIVEPKTTTLASITTAGTATTSQATTASCPLRCIKNCETDELKAQFAECIKINEELEKKCKEKDEEIALLEQKVSCLGFGLQFHFDMLGFLWSRNAKFVVKAIQVQPSNNLRFGTF